MRLILGMLLFPLLSLMATAQKNLTILHFDTLPAIDGFIEDQMTASMEPGSFVQMEPSPGSPASQQIRFLVAQDSLHIYFAFVCYQESEVVARVQKRDELTKNDDEVLVQIGPFHDRQSGYGFMVTPLNTQVDFQISDDGRNVDLNWDTEWLSATRIFEGGWCAEIQIPFKSIKYKNKLDTWDLNVGTIYRENYETNYWSGQVANDFRISQSGILTGIRTPGHKSKLTLLPYGTVQYENSTDNDMEGDFTYNAGGDIIWQMTSTLSTNVTINPDFATVEADAEQINLTRYELSYPEKRVFFLEGNQMFSTRIRTFYSRRIGDIDAGAKVNGKAGKYSMNLLGVRAREDTTRGEPQSYYIAARVKRDILNSSTVGLTFVDKTWKEGSTGSLSGDYVLNLGRTWQLTGQFVASTPAELEKPGGFWDHNAFYIRFARENNIYHYHIRYSNIGELFKDNVNQTGFITDDDRHELDSDVSYKWWIKNNIFEYIDLLSANNIFWSQQGTLRSWYISESVRGYFRSKISLGLSYDNEYKLFEKDYYNHYWGIGLGYNTDEWSSALVQYVWGRNFDRDIDVIEGQGRIKITSKVALEYNGTWLHFEPDTTNASTFINIASIQYNLTPDLWIKVFAQNNTSTERWYVYGLFGWRFKPPFGAIYLIYTRDEYLIPAEPERYTGNIAFIKLTYPITVF
jgi:hypothetical protein